MRLETEFISKLLNFFLGGEALPLSDWNCSALPSLASSAVAPPLVPLVVSLGIPNPQAVESTHLQSLQPPIMVLQDLGRRINSAVNDLTRSNNLDEKVRNGLSLWPATTSHANQTRHSMTCSKRSVPPSCPPT